MNSMFGYEHIEPKSDSLILDNDHSIWGAST
jgi:hypothetical protein